MTSTTPSPSPARRLGAVLALLLAGTLVALVPAPADAAATLTARPAVAGEQLLLRGRVPATRPRPVTLQRRAGDRWVRVAARRTTARGAFGFAVRQSAATTLYRVVAPAAGGSRATSRSFRAAPVAQRLALTISGALETRAPLTVRAAFSPARPGRPWRVERQVDGEWRPVTSGTQTRDGRVAAVVRTPRSAGAFAVRVVAPAWRGAPAVAREATVDLTAVAPRRVGAPQLVTAGLPGTIGVGDAPLGGADVSDGGRWVAFASESTTLTPGGSGGASQVYVRDTVSGTTTRISSTPAGAPGGRWSYEPVISGDGRFVAFTSEADDLVDGDRNGRDDVYLHDRRTGTTTVVSRRPGTPQAAGSSFGVCLSRNGRYLAYSTFAQVISGSAGMQLVRLDRETGTTTTVSRNAEGEYGNAHSNGCRAADDGSVAFVSAASTLVPGDTEGTHDLFLAAPDGALTGLTLRSPDSDVTYLPGGFGLSADGRTVVLVSSSQLLPADTDTDRDLYRYAVDGDPELELVALEQSEADLFGAFVASDGERVVHDTALWSGDPQLPWRPYLPRATDLTSGLTGPVAVRPDGHDSEEYGGRVLGFSDDGSAVLYSTTDPALTGRPTGGVPQLLLQRLEPLD